MTLLTPDAESQRSEKLLESIQQQLEQLRAQIQAHGDGIEAGGKFDETGTQKAITQMHGLIASCLKLETTLAECRRKQTEIVKGGYAFDFAAARFEIGCALNRIRSCCRSGDVS